MFEVKDENVILMKPPIKYCLVYTNMELALHVQYISWHRYGSFFTFYMISTSALESTKPENHPIHILSSRRPGLIVFETLPLLVSPLGLPNSLMFFYLMFPMIIDNMRFV